MRVQLLENLMKAIGELAQVGLCVIEVVLLELVGAEVLFNRLRRLLEMGELALVQVIPAAYLCPPNWIKCSSQAERAS